MDRIFSRGMSRPFRRNFATISDCKPHCQEHGDFIVLLKQENLSTIQNQNNLEFAWHFQTKIEHPLEV